MKRKKFWAKFLLLLSLIVFSVGSAWAEPQGKLIIFHAGSLSVPFARIEKNFEAR